MHMLKQDKNRYISAKQGGETRFLWKKKAEQRNLRLGPFLLQRFPPTGLYVSNRSRATGFAGHAARSAAEIKRTYLKMNEFIFRLAL